jgi:hypothetical protein
VEFLVPKDESLANELWGITTFFNPTGAQRRIANYRRFREHSRRQGLPLVAVELAFDDDGFQLEEGADAEIVVRRRARSVLWQKERMLNLALDALPNSCGGVCWADADILFEDDDWVASCQRLLERHVVIQPFSAAVRLPEDGRIEDFPGSFAGTTGYVWCARRSLLDEHRFYDRCIVGGGDREFALAIAYAPGKVPKRNVRIHHRRLREHIAPWHARVHRAVGKRISHHPGVIHHLWHGSSGKRNYVDRHAILEEFDFDPERDVVLDEGGCWQWGEGNEALAGAVTRYFESRQEDG